jgi:hypothetical protein
MRAKVLGLALWGACFMAGGSASAAEPQDAPGPGQPVVAFRQRVRSLWEHEQFGELEKIAEESRAGKLRCSDGYWQLAHFYDVLRRRDDPQDRDIWLEILDKAERWAAASPRSVTAQIVLAGSWVGYAWYSRGHRYRNVAMDEDERAVFLERLGKARAILDEAEKLPVSDPHLLHIMQLVARGEGWSKERYEKLFRKAVRQEPTYYSYYYEKTLYVLPEWYGEPGDLAAFAAEAAKGTRAQEGEVIYALVAMCAYFWTHGDQGKDLSYFETQGLSWPRVRKGFEDFDERYPNSPTNLNCFALLACMARDKEAARVVLDRLGAKYIRGYWLNEGQYQECRDWAHDDRPDTSWLRPLLPTE